MIKVTPYNVNTSCKISFGTTERRSNLKLEKNGYRVANCDYFVRPDETPPDKIGRFLLEEAQKSKEVERKIWGCSDLSMFVSRKLAMINSVGENKYREIFPQVELIDIDEDIVNRAKKGLIGVTSFDFEEFEASLGFRLQDHLTPVDDKTNFFLDNEPRFFQLPYVGEYEIEPYRLSDKVMEGLNIHTGDIREDLSNLSNPRKGLKRIFEFANGWYFMSSEDQVEIASLLSKKMQVSDIMLVGDCEIENGVGDLLKSFGFEQDRRIPEVFRKVGDLSESKINWFKRLMGFVHKG